mmetsp:Transcript_19711/g.34993  ORF Transcript_19711/g.34993 Transcript_19711/m.34993 type:complete len:234 (+) Transcript_19711:55-756(+)
MIAVSLLALLFIRASADADVTKALDVEDTCEGGSCGLELLQLQGEKKTQHSEALEWQGARETGSTCWSSCNGDIGPAECYHFRCVCRNGYVFSKQYGSRCVSNADAVSTGTIGPQDTGKTCYFADCSDALTACIDHKCRCIANYIMDWNQGRCRLPYEIWGHPQEASSTETSTLGTETSTIELTTSRTTTLVSTSEPKSVALNGDALCSAHPGCAGHNGFCCPTESGLRLECC